MALEGRFERVLVTGGAGFIGSHLVPWLVERGARVTVLDDLSSPAGPGVRAVSDRGDVRFVEGAVGDAALVDRLVSESDAVVHLAAVVGVRRVLEDPIRTLSVLTEGTSVVLHAAARRGVRLLYASSSEVYGRGTSSPFRETDPVVMGPPQAGRWTYALGKLYGEMLGVQLARRDGFSFLAARLFNVVGPGQRADQGMVLPSFAERAVRHEPLRVHAPGTQRRCYTHARDAASILGRLLQAGTEVPAVVNVGSTQLATVRELAERIVAISGSRGGFEVVDADTVMPAGFEEIHERVPDLSTLERVLGPQAYVSLEQILAEVVEAARIGSTSRSS